MFKKSRKSCFMKALILEINKQKEILSDSRKFIKNKNLTMYNFGKKYINVTEADLPTDTILGSSYLIKKNTILEIYSWCDSSYSFYIQLNIKRPTWISKIDIISCENNDPNNVNYILNGSKTFDDPDTLQYMIAQFINDGFSLYLHL